MMQLEVGGRRHPVPAGETVVGSDAECGLPLAGEGIRPRHAILLGTGAGVAIRAAAPEAEVLVNGVRLGADPTPVLHGDKIQLGETEILVVDDRTAGGTQIMSGMALRDVAPPPPAAGEPAAAGRLVCLTDGREYALGGGPIVLGRDAGCDVVVPGGEVSRRHAEVRWAGDAYEAVDISSNGTFVNGERIEGSRRLVHGDVLRAGPDEFRFSRTGAGAPARQAPPPPRAADPASLVPTPPPSPAYQAPPAMSATPPPGAANRLFDTMHGFPVTPRATPAVEATPRLAPVLASLLVRAGALKGKRLSVRAPVVNIGRADFNDIVLPESSVSTAHAKLQRRDGIWMLTDLGSMNGTTVDGEPVTEDTPLGPGATLKFGEVAVLFEPADDEMPAAASGSGTQAMRRLGAERSAEAAGAPPAESSAAARARSEAASNAARRMMVGTARRRTRPLTWILVAVLVAAAAAAAYTLLLTP